MYVEVVGQQPVNLTREPGGEHREHEIGGQAGGRKAERERTARVLRCKH